MHPKLTSEIWYCTSVICEQRYALFYVVINPEGYLHHLSDKMVFGNWRKTTTSREGEVVVAYKILEESPNIDLNNLSPKIHTIIEEIEADHSKLETDFQGCRNLRYNFYNFERVTRIEDFALNESVSISHSMPDPLFYRQEELSIVSQV